MERIRVIAIGFFYLLATARGFGAEGAPELLWHDMHGTPQNLTSYKGKIIVLNFWATWCVPCKHEMVQPFAEKNNILFPVLLGANTDQMQKLQLGEAIPATAFFDTDGNLVARVLGELEKSDLEKRLDWMLGKHHGKAPPIFMNKFQKKNQPEGAPSVFH
jgi:thiol-disulfide isomerase/thioredoxin